MPAKRKDNLKPNRKSGVLSRTNLYGFELFMAVIGLFATAFVVDYGLFSLFRYFSHGASTYQGPERIVIVLLAAILVWLPVAVFFYLRVRGELNQNPHTRTTVHKTIVSTYLALNSLIALGALFYTIYALLELAVMPVLDSMDVILQQVIPGLLMTIWHGLMLFAFTNRFSKTGRSFSLIFGIVTIMIVGLLFIVAVGGIRASALDRQREHDLSLIQSSLLNYSSAEGSLPSNLKFVDIDQENLANGIDNYRYERKGNMQYEICTDFIIDTSAKNPDYDLSSSRYTEYPLWSQHSSGNQCYNISVMGYDNRTLD